MRRPHPLHAAAFLIDQHRRIRAAENVAKRARQRSQLLAVDHIALEEDQPPGPPLADEGAFLVAEGGAGAANDERARHPRALRATSVNSSPRSSRRRSTSAW